MSVASIQTAAFTWQSILWSDLRHPYAVSPTHGPLINGFENRATVKVEWATWQGGLHEQDDED
jgi:hypothetical protein